MRIRGYILLIALAGFLAAGGEAAAQTASFGPGVFNIDSLLGVHFLATDQNLRSDKISGDSLSSIHLTQIRAGVESHHHARHQETVWIIRGAGRLVLNNKKQKVGAGTVILIPPGTQHSFHSLGVTPTVVISVFSPGFDGKDRIYENPQSR